MYVYNTYRTNYLRYNEPHGRHYRDIRTHAGHIIEDAMNLVGHTYRTHTGSIIANTTKHVGHTTETLEHVQAI